MKTRFFHLKFQIKLKRCIAFVLAAGMLLGFRVPALADESSNYNRYNVMIVLDASASMRDTDPDGLRYEAIDQFTHLLAEQGNYLGGLVFSTKIEAQINPIQIRSQADKDQVYDLLKSIEPKVWTNIGDALDAAVQALSAYGDPALPSVIVFLSDGNTEMASDELERNSLNQKAEALIAAREKGITIYSVCLNRDSTADTMEMAQLAQATNGVFQEVHSAGDLQDVFNMFYNLIYGTSTITLIDETFPTGGIVEKEFTIPGIGVEEVNIIIYGKTSNVTLFKPDGTKGTTSLKVANTFSMMKLTDIVPGVWKITTQGTPGDQIKVNMVYNTDLAIDIESNATQGKLFAGEPVILRAFLRSGTQRAATAAQYDGYLAEAHIQNAYGDEVSVLPMDFVEDHFELQTELLEGSYFFEVRVTGYQLEKTSDRFGPLQVAAAPTPSPTRAPSSTQEPPTPSPSPEPAAPEPVENPVRKTVYILPFREPEMTLQLEGLVLDPQKDDLQFSIASSSFLEGMDYTLDGNVLTQNHFSVSSGSYTVHVVNSDGLSCDIEVIVRSHNVGLIALVVLGALALIALVGLIIGLYIAFTRPFRGEIDARSIKNGVERGKRQSPKRGRCRLSAFNLDSIGLDYYKSYFLATGENYIYLVVKKGKVFCNGQETNKVKLPSGVKTIVRLTPDAENRLELQFDSRVHPKRSR